VLVEGSEATCIPAVMFAVPVAITVAESSRCICYFPIENRYGLLGKELVMNKTLVLMRLLVNMSLKIDEQPNGGTYINR